MRFQQFTAPVFAKGVEDTAFYRYNALISANDVGGHPGRPAIGPEEFHASNSQRLADWPLELIATATHDAKRGEDARARIDVISEIPGEWRRGVAEWMRVNGRNRTKVEGAWAPDRNDEYLFYQALVGAWPADAASTPVPARAPQPLVDRMAEYMQKAVREAKLHTSWIHEQADYGRAVAQFVERTLASRTSARFLASFLPLQRRIARAGMVNSLAQLALKIASPGVPDFYQGTELWDLSLVDPDNRRPVDFGSRRTLLDSLQPLMQRLGAGQAIARDVDELIEQWFDGRIKLLVAACGLRLRRDHPELLLSGGYEPLTAEGAAADHLIGFARCDGSDTLLVIAPRLTASLPADERSLPRGARAWRDAQVLLPASASAERYRHVITGEVVEAAHGRLPAADVFRTSPVALLWADRSIQGAEHARLSGRVMSA
jgi:(1->4)-alpha-D-glucan 1-alpha-D-glucosylmutase